MFQIIAASLFEASRASECSYQSENCDWRIHDARRIARHAVRKPDARNEMARQK